jgi:SNF2 family DNA or RNA helicase
MLKPYAHQIRAFEFIKDKNSFALFMDMGTGKSQVILMKLSYLIDQKLIDKAVIICPNYLKYSWLQDHFIHFEKEYKSYIYEGNVTSQKGKKEFKNFCDSKEFRVFVVNVEAFQSTTIDKYVKSFLNDRNAMVVIDESTIIKNPKAKRSEKILIGFKNFQYKAILSGTPTPHSPADLWSQFNFLQSDFFQCNYFQFKHRHIILTQQKTQENKPYDSILLEKDYNIIKNALKKISVTSDNLLELSIKYKISESNIMRIYKMEKYFPYKDLEKLNEQISKITFKVMKKEACPDLPDKIFDKIIVELNVEQKRMYKELTKNFLTQYKEDELTVSNMLSLLIRLRMITGGIFPYLDTQGIDFDNIENINMDNLKKVKRIENNPKINALIEDIENVEESTSIVIWSNFTECIKYLYDEIKPHYECETYYGVTKNREEIIEKFKNKSVKILIANPMTAGMGLNLQVSTLHYFFDNGFRADFRTQAEDRSHRIGQKNCVLYKDIIAKGTVDEKILNLIKNKIDLLDYFKNNIKEVVKEIKSF